MTLSRPATDRLAIRQAVAGRLPVFVAGLYCVLVAVVPVGFASGAPTLARASTWLSLVSLPLCLLVPPPRIALAAGMLGVLGGAISTFAAALWAGERFTASPLAILGFVALSLAWGALSSPAARQGVGQGVAASWLNPRQAVPKWQVTLAGLVLLSLPLLLLPAITIESPAKAAFALVLALGLILLVARATSELFTRVWLPDGTAPLTSGRGLRLALELLLVLAALSAVLFLPDL